MHALLPVLPALSLLLAGAPAKKADPPVPAGKATVTEAAVALDAQDEARKVAEAYLKALSGQGGAEALMTTGAGLLVALPAAAAHQLLTARLRQIETRNAIFASRVLNLYRREFLSGAN